MTIGSWWRRLTAHGLHRQEALLPVSHDPVSLTDLEAGAVIEDVEEAQRDLEARIEALRAEVRAHTHRD